MDSVNSFTGYGKVDEPEEQAFKKKTRKHIISILLSTVLLAAVITTAAVGTVIHRRNTSSDSATSAPPTELTPSASLKSVCQVTQYPNSCFSSISSLPNSNTTDPQLLFKLSLHVAIDELSKLSQYPSNFSAITNDGRMKSAWSVCQTVLDDAMGKLNESISAMEVSKGENWKVLSVSTIKDIETWLSTTLTDIQTCLDAFEELNSSASKDVLFGLKTAMENSTEFASNSLAIVSKVLSVLTDFNIPIHRRLLGSGRSDLSFPEWVGPVEKRLLHENNTAEDVHFTVSKDGSGDFQSIKEAVAQVPKKSETRYVIYVKEGRYEENVVLDKDKWNVMIIGDGKDKTVVSGSLNFIDGTPTFHTATFAVVGKGFIAKGIGFFNTAGAAKHQAVAFRSGSDRSVYYRCAFDGFQDTLYVHSNRQFYRECDITGTVDFIFGNAAVVFQSCNIMPRQPLPNQFNAITAQGKKDPNQNTAISIQKCSFSAFDNLTAPTYLGRPWQQYATTVVMQSDIGSFLHPLGWTPWVQNLDPPGTIFYAEYQNSGPGSSVVDRVKWVGYTAALTEDEAAMFTVDSLIQGHDWLGGTEVTYDNSL